MKRAILAALAASVLPTAGCQMSSGFDDEWGWSGTGSEARPRPPAACAPDDAAWSRASSLYASTENSVHELITCGGMQVNLAKSLLVIVIASNRELFEAETYEQLTSYAQDFGMMLEVPFEREQGGRWAMPIGTGRDSRFALEFFDPASGDTITANPFVMDSYLAGVKVENEHTFEEMMAAWELRNTLTFTWESEGPLVHLLNGGDPVPNPFIVRVSMWDIAALAFGMESGGEFGPLMSLVDAEMASNVHMLDERGIDVVKYDVNVPRDTVANVASTQALPFDVRSIDATDGRLSIDGDARNLRFVRLGTLAGSVTYTVRGPGVNLVAVSDFGGGASYPTTDWRCPEARD